MWQVFFFFFFFHGLGNSLDQILARGPPWLGLIEVIIVFSIGRQVMAIITSSRVVFLLGLFGVVSSRAEFVISQWFRESLEELFFHPPFLEKGLILW